MSTSFEIHSLKFKAGQKSFHPQSCLYSNQIEQLSAQILGEERCALVTVGTQKLPAIYCRDQLIAVRFFSKKWAEAFDSSHITKAALETLVLQQLKELRLQKTRLLNGEGEAFRWVHGDADGLPGVVIDDYASIVVVQCGSQFGDFLLPVLIPALLQATQKPIFERSSGQIRALEKLPERTRWIRETSHDGRKTNTETVQTQLAGLQLQFKPMRCQKTGLFIDQRENLEIFKSTGTALKVRSMLDLCSYVGAWSCAGARAGVESFTLVDQDKDALETSRINIEKNISSGQKSSVTTLHGDLFEILSKMGKERAQFDAVVADPPAFTKSAKHIPEAKRAYQRLTKLASRLVNPQGLYVACSCSRHIDEEEFYDIVSSSLDADDWIYLGRGRQSTDHTVLTTDKQSLYLKALFFQRRSELPQISLRDETKRGTQS